MTRHLRWLALALIALCAVVLALFVTGNFFPKKRHLSSGTSKHQEVEDEHPATVSTSLPSNPEVESSSKLQQLFRTQIRFWGIVRDQSETPVEGANVRMSAVTDLAGGATVYNTQTDANGAFVLEGASGSSLSVSVTKEGYYQSKLSSRSFSFLPGGEQSLPRPDAPAVFILIKQGEKEPLKYGNVSEPLPPNGTPLELNLQNGQRVAPGAGDLRVETWIDSEKDQQNRFDWRCRISAPRGGLSPRTNTFDFVAPETGYRDADEITMSRGEERWDSQATREYFVKVGDYFGRVTLRVVPAGDRFCRLEWYLNPLIGKRTLEPDPATLIKIQR